MARWPSRWSSLAAGALLLAVGGRASAQSARTLRVPDAGAAELSRRAARSPQGTFRGTVLSWDNSVTTQTLGIGGDYQSTNPTYEMMFRLAPRYSIYEKEGRELAARADVRLVREFTNSDRTTERGEWTFTDTELWLEGTEPISRTPGRKSQVYARAPVLILPTSKFSSMAGRILGLGLSLGFDQDVPLAPGAATLPRLTLRPRVNYAYQFSRAVVAVNDRIDRVRIDPDGRSFTSDQLNGSALNEHQLAVGSRFDTHVTEQLMLSLDLGLRYVHRYALPEQVSLCGNVATGCAPIEARADATRWGVATAFVFTASYIVAEYAEFSLGYANLASQLGEDGQRRNAFYSPNARFFAAVGVSLDVFYDRS